MMRSTDDGFEVWYRAEHPRLVVVLALESGDVEVAQDAASEAFARALERWERVATMASPAAWTRRWPILSRCHACDAAPRPSAVGAAPGRLGL